MNMMEIRVPDIGDFKEVEVIEVLVKAGDVIKAEQSLVTVESDKASMEIPSSAAGVVKDVQVKLGDKIAEGSVMLTLEVAGTAPASTPASTAAPAAASAPAAAPVAVAATPSASTASAAASAAAPVQSAPAAHVERSTPNDASGALLAHASPSVRKFARELGVDLNLVTGTGPNQRILHEDVQGYVKGAVAAVVSGKVGTAAPSGGTGQGLQLIPWPSLDFSKFGPTETLALSRIKRLSGPNLARNWAMIPHVTQFDEADITDLEQFRKDSNDALAKSGTKLTMLAFVIKASVSALKKFPNFNASLDASGENLIIKQYWNIGFAADTPNGLVVPVVKDADKKGMSQIAKELGELSALARDGKLKPADMQGATFTISSLGGVGGTAFTPIINAPEVAILGLSRSQMKPVWDGKQFVPRLMLPLSLSFDHRVIDGAQAARFAAYLGEVLADMRKILL